MGRKDKNLPAVRMSGNEVARRLDGVTRALEIRGPVSEFFHGIQTRATTRALDSLTTETQAFTRNMNAQADAVRSIVKLRDAVDEYRARDELADLHYENIRERQIDQV